MDMKQEALEYHEDGRPGKIETTKPIIACLATTSVYRLHGTRYLVTTTS